MASTERRVVLGRYRILRPIARGGMGVIYLARVEGAAGFSRPVALKRVVPDRAHDPSTLKLFVREARIMSQLSHPNIVNVIDFGEEDGDYVMVLEYVRGYNLGAWHKYVLDSERSIPVDQCVHVISSVLDALSYAHTFKRPDGTATPVIHRDVSPANVLLDIRGNAKLLDFGIARIEGGGEYRTRDGTLKGKLPFTAPEVFSGKDPTERSDIYSAGVLLYMLLANENPFRGADARSTIGRVLQHVPEPPSARNPQVDATLDAIVMRALAKEPAERFESAAEFAATLRATSSHPAFQVLTELGKMLEQDFLGPMPDQLGLTRLETLDEASTFDEPVIDFDGPLTDVTDTVITPMQMQSSGAPAPQPKKSPALSLLLAGALLVAGAAGIVVWANSDSKPAQVIVIQKESAGRVAAAEAPAAPALQPTNAPEPVPSAEAPVEPAGPTATAEALPPPGAAPQPAQGPGSGSLTASFRARQPLVQSCFSKHASNVEGAPRITLRFSVDRSGKVTSASVSPGSLAATPLGACLLSVAQGTKFSPQSDPVTFSIPITARKVQ